MITRNILPATKRTLALLAAIALLPSLALATGRLVQIGTLSSLAAGVYDGESNMEPLQRPQAFGLGTFDKLDGEMVVLDGVVYRVGIDGKVTKPAPSTKIPFAAVSVLDTPDVASDLGAVATKTEFEALVLSKLQSVNYPVLIVVNARFSAMKTRSVPAQQKPYEPLAGVCATQQKVFDLGSIEGTLVGFYCPSYMGGLNAPGFHLHFLSYAHDSGGHVLDFTMIDGKLRMQYLTGIQAILPSLESSFATSDTEPAKQKKLDGE